MTPLDPIFFSTFMYSACKVTGLDGPALLQYEMMRAPGDPVASWDASAWPGFRTLAQACRVAECRVYIDGSTYITRARCVAANHFLRKAGKDTDVWLTCDDDVFAEADVLRTVVTACRDTRGLVAVPYVNRDGGSMTFRRVFGETLVGDRYALRQVDRVGMGLVAMHRELVSALDADAQHFEDGAPGIFLEGPQDGVWVGEDYWVCSLVEKLGLPMHVLLEAPASHAGKWGMLDAHGNILMRDARDARALEKGIADKNARAAAGQAAATPMVDVPPPEPSTRADKPKPAA